MRTQSASTNANTLDDYEGGTWLHLAFSGYSGTDQNVVWCIIQRLEILVTAGCRLGTDGTSDSSVATICRITFYCKSRWRRLEAIGGGLVTYTQGLAAQRWYAFINTATRLSVLMEQEMMQSTNDFGANKDSMLISNIFCIRRYNGNN